MNEEELQWLKEISTTTGISYSGDMTITTDFANKLIDYIKELEQLQNNWNELKKWLEVTIKQYDEIGLKFKKQGNFDCASRSYDYLKQYQAMLFKMQELEQGKDE